MSDSHTNIYPRAMRWLQPQLSERDGFVDTGTESSAVAQGLQTFHHSTARGSALLCKDQELTLAWNSLSKKQQPSFFHCIAQPNVMAILLSPLIFFNNKSQQLKGRDLIQKYGTQKTCSMPASVWISIRLF